MIVKKISSLRKLLNEKAGKQVWEKRKQMLSDKNMPVLTGNTTSMLVWRVECVCLGGGNLFSCFLATLNSDSVKQEFAFQLGSDTLILCYKGNIPFVLLCKFLFRNSRWLGCSQDLDKSFFKAQTMCIVTKITVSAKGGTDTKLCGVWLTFWTSQVFGTMHKEVLQKT